MNRLLIIFCLSACITATANAQTYTHHLQEKVAGKGSVVVTQSAEIDKLVNTANVSSKANDATHTSKPAPTHTQPTVKTNTATEHEAPTREPARHHEAAQHQHPSTDNTEAPVVDTSKKVMRRSYKTKGYRVQVYAGGNSRNDKIKAQQAGNAVKAAFPSQPIYVHFYSPRWICRMGNYRTYDEANAILQQVKKLGYKQACIVSGKISVAY